MSEKKIKVTNLWSLEQASARAKAAFDNARAEQARARQKVERDERELQSAIDDAKRLQAKIGALRKAIPREREELAAHVEETTAAYITFERARLAHEAAIQEQRDDLLNTLIERGEVSVDVRVRPLSADDLAGDGGER